MASILLSIIFYRILCIFVKSSSAQSVEIDGFDALSSPWSPIHEAVIVGDVADILTEIDKNPNLHWEEFFNSDSESDEDIEDLLSEYHHYLNRAQKQRLEYLEKNKLKNKVPLMRHETYTKNKPQSKVKNDIYFYPSGHKPMNLHSAFNLPTAPRIQSTNKLDSTTNCVCEPNRLPCDCGHMLRDITSSYLPTRFSTRSPFSSHLADSPALTMVNDPYIDNPLNYIKVKIDIQMPIAEVRQSNFNSLPCNMPFSSLLNPLCREDVSFDNAPLNTPSYGLMPFNGSPYSIASSKNSPFGSMPLNNMQMEILGFKKEPNIKNDANQLRKLSIHKRKKSKSLNNNKRHKKKLVTFHKLKLDGVQTFPIEENINLTNILIHLNNLKENFTDHFENFGTTNESSTVAIYNVTEKGKILDIHNSTNTTKLINEVEDGQRIENSIDTGMEPEKTSKQTKSSNTVQLRTKRSSKLNTTISKLKKITNSSNTINNTQIIKRIKKLEKEIDEELLLWPNNSVPITTAQNITTIILERENHKAKLNISKEALHVNHTKILEKAIFGDVDWNDVDTIAPIFMSFLGKYIRGVLTFCSDKSCHSIKCAEKLCHHRVCTPTERLNQKGHCAKSNSSDGVATMESIMDLPSNIVFETVDILKDRMMGKLYGKVTMCINSKCITFLTTKKIFIKSKCSHKELNTLGHCQNIKLPKDMGL